MVFNWITWIPDNKKLNCHVSVNFAFVKILTVHRSFSMNCSTLMPSRELNSILPYFIFFCRWYWNSISKDRQPFSKPWWRQFSESSWWHFGWDWSLIKWGARGLVKFGTIFTRVRRWVWFLTSIKGMFLDFNIIFLCRQ